MAFVILASRMPFALPSTIMSGEMGRYDGTLCCNFAECGVSIPSYDVLSVGHFGPSKKNMVSRIFTDRLSTLAFGSKWYVFDQHWNCSVVQFQYFNFTIVQG